ncbi:MAG TPA: hypothetical protein VGA77_01530 [Propylenella sp.]
MAIRIGGLSLAMACFLGAAGAVAAEQSAGEAGRPALGTPGAMSSARAAAARIDLGAIDPSKVFENAAFATGGVGLRNRRIGGVEISGVSGGVKRAFAYWAVITDGPPGPAVRSVQLRRLFPGPPTPFETISGVAIGTGDSPCWSGDRITVYRGAVPKSVASGNGQYLVKLNNGANGNTDGRDPWASDGSLALPLFEGLSLVIISRGNATVAVYDGDFAGAMFFDELVYRLKLPVGLAGASQVLFHNIGADGQKGNSLTVFAATAAEVTTLAGQAIAGPGSPANDSDWNGAIAGPLPQLWDDTGHDVTAEALQSPTNKTLSLSVQAPDDCLVPVANVVSIDKTAP